MKPSIGIGETYAATSGPDFIWRVDKVLADGVHVVLVCDDEASHRKTVSAWALGDRRYFKPATPRAA